MVTRVIASLLALAASSASAAEKNITITNQGAAVATLSVPASAKIASTAGKTVIDTKEWNNLLLDRS